MRLALAGVGAVIGGYFGGPQGAQAGFAIGAAVGTLLDPADTVTTRGPRLDDLRIQTSTFGKPITRVHGTYQIAGNVIWSSGIKETTVTEEVGGKGGFGGASAENVRYLYSASLAIGLCKGPIAGMLRVKADGKLIGDFTSTNTGATVANGRLRLYLGTDSQMPDPLIQADIGVADTPAHRGLAYLVVEDLQLADFGNRIPNITVEVFTEGGGAFPVRSDGPLPTGASNDDVWRAGDGNFYSRGVSTFGKFDPLSATVEFNTLVSDPLGIVPQLLGSGAAAVDGDGTYIYACGNDLNAGRVNKINLSAGVFAEAKIGGASISPSQYDMSAASRIVSWGTALQSITFTDHTGTPITGQAEVLAVLNANKLTIINPLGSMLINTEIDGGPDLEGLNCGWGAIDSGLHVWVCGNDGTTVKVFEFQIDLTRNAPARLDLLGQQSPPYLRSTTDISSQILAFDATEDIPVSYIPEQDALLIYHDGYAYLFDLASRTLTGAGILVNGGGSGLSVETTMKGGVAADGRIVFKENETELNLLDTRTWTIERSKYDTDDFSIPPPSEGSGYVDALNAWVGVEGGTAYVLYLDRQDDGSKPLDLVVREELQQSELTAGEIDVSGLVGKVTRGYMVPTRSRVRENVAPLATVHAFDLPEIDGKMVAVPRGGALSFAIPEADLGAYADGGARPVSLLESRAAERALPFRIDLGYASRAGNYEPGLQHDVRVEEATATRVHLSVATPEVLSDDEAKQVVRRLLAEAWEAELSYETSYGVKHLRLDPSDRGTLTHGGVVREVRINQVDLGADWVLQARLVRDTGSVYQQTAAGAPIAFDPGTMKSVAEPVMFLMDTPMLRDADDGFGLYGAAGPDRDDPTWPSGVILDSDDGVAFQALLDLTAGVAYGYALGVLADQPRWTVRDHANTLTVNWVNGDLPVSVTDAQFLDNANAYLVGDEVVLVRDVTDNGDGSFTFSTLLRARLGTEDKVASHGPGERVIFLSEATVRRAATDVGRKDVTRYFKVATSGQTVPPTEITLFANTGRSSKPLSPYHIQIGRQANGDLTITWVRRSRFRGLWPQTLASMLGEAAEGYELDILALDGSIARTVTGLAAPSYTYLRADQIDDGNGGLMAGVGSAIAITNGGAEAGDMTGWTVTAGTIESVPDGSGHPDPIEGVRIFRGFGDFVGFNIMEQEIDLVAGGVSATDIDNQAVNLLFQYYANVPPSGSWFQAKLRFKDAAKATILTTSGLSHQVPNPDTFPTQGQWQTVGKEVEMHAGVPALTRFVDLIFEHEVVTVVGNGESFWDNFRLSHGPPASPNLTLDAYQTSALVGRGIARRHTA